MTIIIKPCFSIWVQLSSLSFCLAGQFSDLLIIRLCLTSAYIFTFINCSAGGPLWPHLVLPDQIQLDQLCWAAINLYVHISIVVRLLNDERVFDKSSKNHNEKLALWRMFFRTGGLSQKLYEKLISCYCDVITYQKDDILDTDMYFYIIYQGTVKMTVTDSDTNEMLSSICLQSGQIFDFRALGLLVDYSNILSKHVVHVITISKQCIVFRFVRSLMPTIVQNPNTKLLFKEILMENMLRMVQSNFDKRLHHKLLTRHDTFIHPIFYELDNTELPNPARAGSTEALRNPLYHIYQYMKWSFAPPWPFQVPPTGLRHNQLLIGTGTGRKLHLSPSNQDSMISSDPPELSDNDEIIRIPVNENTTMLSSNTNNKESLKHQNTATTRTSTSLHDKTNYSSDLEYPNDDMNHDSAAMLDYVSTLDKYDLEEVAWGMYGLGFIPATGVQRFPSAIFMNRNSSHSRCSSSNGSTASFASEIRIKITKRRRKRRRNKKDPKKQMNVDQLSA